MGYKLRTKLHNGIELEAECDDDSLAATLANIERLKGTAAAAPVEQIPAFPAKLLAYAKSWGEPWAEEDCLDRAKRLWLEHHNWDVVFQKLCDQDGVKSGDE